MKIQSFFSIFINDFSIVIIHFSIISRSLYILNHSIATLWTSGSAAESLLWDLRGHATNVQYFDSL